MEALFQKQIIHERILVPYTTIGRDMDNYFQSYVETHIEGKCRNEGYIKEKKKEKISKVLHYSAGLLKGSQVEFIVVFEVEACMPYEDMVLTCIIKNINKIGMRCIIQEENNPMNIFISNETNVDMDKYNENDEIKVKVIGHRFELNDTFISIIAEII